MCFVQVGCLIWYHVHHVAFSLTLNIPLTVELQWLKQFWYHKNIFETGVVQANEVNHRAKSGGIIGIFFRFSLT